MELLLARMQFASTTIYHFFFVPLTLGLSIMVAVMQTIYVRTGNEMYKKMTQFFGHLFLINFAMGVVTGIVQEFQFGMNWSEYSRFVGDIFGVPLAIEALMAFFMESVFLGLWVFGWDKLPKKVHLATIWLVAIGSNLSALWILIANSFMQQPVGYVLRNGRAELTDFFALVGNGHVWVQWPHTFTAAMATAGFFILAVSAWHLKRDISAENEALFSASFRLGAITALVFSLMVILVGHDQAQYMFEIQPMKMAAAEALWETEQPADLSVFTIADVEAQKDVFAIKIPAGLSFLACNNFSCEITGIKDIQAKYEQLYGPGNYIPPVFIIYWTFRIMVGIGFAMFGLAAGAVFLVYKKMVRRYPLVLLGAVYAVALPYLANTTGWIFTEVGRSPWIVFTLQTLPDAVSPNVGVFALSLSLTVFILLYGALMGVTIYLLLKFAKHSPYAELPPQKETRGQAVVRA